MFSKFISIILLSTFLYSHDLIEVSYLKEIYSDLKYQNSRSALKIWIQDLTKDMGMNVEIISYQKYETLLESYLTNKTGIMAINPYYYLLNKKEFDSSTKEIWDLRREKDVKFQQMYLVVNKDSNITKVSQLRKKKVVLKENNYLGKIYLEKLFLEEKKSNSKKFMSRVHGINTNTALIKTYFGSYDACIINSHEYKIMLELNPSITKRLTILKMSPKIFNNHMFMFNNMNKKSDMDIYRNTLIKFLKGSKKQDFFELLKIEEIKVIKPEDLDVLNNFFNEYNELIKKYNK